VAQELSGQCGLLFTDEEEDAVVRWAAALNGFRCPGIQANPAALRSWFDQYEVEDFARAGTVSSLTYTLEAGPLTMFQHTMVIALFSLAPAGPNVAVTCGRGLLQEPMLRTKLQMPVELRRGVVTLLKPHNVCQEGQELTPEQAQILGLLQIKTSTFKPELHCKWWVLPSTVPGGVCCASARIGTDLRVNGCAWGINTGGVASSRSSNRTRV
jgi:mRNA turnover protein 4